jgi:penicillin amidase
MAKLFRAIKRTVATVSLLALTVGLGAVGTGAYLFHRAQPAYDGDSRLPGLSAPVRVWRDAHGVPHIFGANRDDAARALGYVHAGERLFQMELQRRAGQGRLAELFGKDMVGIDQLTRTLGLYRLAQSSFDAMSPDAQATFRAYADGVNAWLDTHRDALPPELILLRDTPDKWQPADSVVWGKLMALQLSHNYRLELLRAQLSSTLPLHQMTWLFPAPSADSPVTTLPGGQGAPPASVAPVEAPSASSPPPAALPTQGNQTALPDPLRTLATLLGIDHAASNEWVVGGDRTVTGKPMLANDPHLGLEAPILWYLARIVTPEGSVKGATVPGLPVVLLGQNDHVAWGFTTTGSDTQDLFVETVDPTDPTRYLTPGGSAPFETHTEIIHVRNAPDTVLAVRTTRHGPVLSDIDPNMAQTVGDDKVMALAFTGLGDKDTSSEALLRLDAARNAGEFRDALKLYQTPTQNIVYADGDGVYGFINPGLVPVRKKGYGVLPVDGASGDYDWTGTVPFENLPQIVNPDEGYIFNANNAVVKPDFPAWLGRDWEEDFRARRLRQLIDIPGPFTLDRMAAMQADHISLAARELLHLLLNIEPSGPRAGKALDMLRNWDGDMDADKPQPVIFEAWLYAFHFSMLPAKLGLDTGDMGPFSASALQSLAADHGADWCGATDPDCKKLAAQSLDHALADETVRQGNTMGAWRWGRENVAALHNKFWSHLPLFDKWSDLSVESSGDFYTLDRGGGFGNDPAHPFTRTHGSGYRGIYDLSDPDKSLFMIATGESGHIFSPHYGDLVPLWKQVKAITLSGSEDDLKKTGAAELTLEP